MNMNNSSDEVRSRLRLIILETTNLDIIDTKASLFGFMYSLSAEMFIYILEKASTDIGFEINEKFVNDLENCSFDSLVTAVLKYKQFK